jgi:LysR family transcriptional regulator for metE and metH
MFSTKLESHSLIELRHLRSLLAIEQAGKLAPAAERVHLTPSALSHQIRALESRYGVLFERSPRQGLRFTAAGQRLLALAHEVAAALGAAERDLARLQGDTRGELRIALECHTCFDWLMPVMTEFRRRWPEVEVDLVAGFHPEPLALIREGKADLVIGSRPGAQRPYHVEPLFRFEILVVLPVDHPLARQRRVEPRQLAGETLITYPVPESRIDLIREVLRPAGLHLPRRTAELTVAILQLVASRRGIAALPNWGVTAHVEHNEVVAKRVGQRGLWSELHAVSPRARGDKPNVRDFAAIVRDACAAQLEGIELL